MRAGALVSMMLLAATAHAQTPAYELSPPAPPAAAGPDANPADEVLYPIPPPADSPRPELEDDTVRLSSRLTTRLRALDAGLQGLAARGGSNVVNAVLAFLVGGLFVTLGIVDSANPAAPYLYVAGGVSGVRGVLELFLAPNASGAAITYQHMPMTSQQEVRQRLEYGERALAGMSDQALIHRVIDASLNLAIGVAVVPFYLAPRNFTFDRPIDYFVVIGAGVSAIMGIISLATPSPAEQRWSAYQELRDRLRDERREEEEAAGETPSDDEEQDELGALLGPPRTEWALTPTSFALAF